ncbi:hypothetical protein B9479_000041 [Cryptococcus floricola]|uniref:Protein Zds1 C-terminal domain-containing protein n=1 Tax=Cryptococcus floricola TaxID=2591691 RepID=A0A5D3B851_9TREE|nr:hypothetical protein B9479_000041 [Cryptococcus floricola]
MSNSEVSDQEIKREIQTLRNLRRRSITSAGPGALPLDPDLPPPSPNQQHEHHPEYSSNDDVTLSSSDGLDGEGLFWVPAHIHPELAPGEFRAFLKSHTSSDPTHADADDAGDAEGLDRSSSWLSRNPSRRSEGLGRKRSMLSRQYQPKAGDNVEEERPPLPSRRPMSIYGGRSGEKGLTLQDLQKLEQLVDETDETDDPEDMRKLLRRSLSMNVAPGFLQDDVPLPDGSEPPLVAPRPGSILRRSARTKIRKAGLQGDGGGHRFAATRKGRTTAAPQVEIPGLEDDDYGSPGESPHRGSDENTSYEGDEKYHDAQDIERRHSDDSTDDIFDAYAHEPMESLSSSSHDHSTSTSPSPERSPPQMKLSLPPISEPTDWFSEHERTPTADNTMASGMDNLSLGDPVTPTQRSTLLPNEHELPPGMAPPQQRINLPPPAPPAPAATPALAPISTTHYEPPTLSRTDTGLSTSSTNTKEKEKKSKLFGRKKEDKEDKKKKKDKDRFLGSLFGGKKKQEDPSPVSNFSADGRAAAAALLGSSKSARSAGMPPSPSPTSPGFQSFARYPIHVERAVYRLSHIKLANARRPLYEQVLISNLMFWYLGILGRNVTEEKKANAEEKKEEAKPVAKGTPPKPADVGTAAKPGQVIHRPPLQPINTTPHIEPQLSSPSPQSPVKKAGLIKPERSRDGRNSEAAVRTPQYGVQTAQVEQEVRHAQMKQQPAQTQLPMRSHSPHPPPSQSQAQPAYQAHHAPQQQQHHVQQQRSVTPSGPARTISPPSPGLNGPRSPEGNYHREIPSAARGVPQSSFGPPPPPQGLDTSRQRTLSNPNLGAPVPVQGGQQRRVVTEGRSSVDASRSHHGAHAGPQPGQLFQYPGGAQGQTQGQAVGPASPFPPRPSQSPGPQPGQAYSRSPPPLNSQQGMPPQPGQIFQHSHHQQQQHQGHPSQQRYPQQGYGRPLPPTGHQSQTPGQQWEPPQRLPPGASPPQWASPGPQRPPAQQSGQYDPRRTSPQGGYPPQAAGQGFYGAQGSAPSQGRPVAVQQGQGYHHGGEYAHHR